MDNNKTLVVGLEHFIDKIGYQAKGYYENNIDVKYLVVDTSGLSLEKAKRYNAQVVTVPKNLILRILVTIYHIIKFNPLFIEIYDIGRATIFYTLIAKIFGLKSILILRGGEFNTTGFRKKGLVWSLKACNHIIAKEFNIINDLKKIDTEKQKISFLYNAVSIPNENDIESHDDRPIDILYLNSVRKMRNVDILVEALSYLLVERPYLRVVITGFTTLDDNNYKMEPEYEEKVISLLEQKGLKDRVTIKGFVSDPSDYYKKSKIFVLPADVIFLNYSLLEAMSYGVLPIVGDGEGAEKIIENGINGYITERSPKKLKDTLRKALDSETTGIIKKNARKTVIEKFGIEEWVQEIIKIRNKI